MLFSSTWHHGPAGLLVLVAIDSAVIFAFWHQVARPLLSAEARRATRILDRMPDGILLLDKDGRVEWINPAAERLLGVAARRAKKRAVDAFLGAPPAGHDDWKTYLVLCQSGARCRELELPLTRMDGVERMLAIETSALGGPEGSTFLMVARDVTERRRSEQELRRSETSLAEAQRIAHLGNWESDLVANKLVWSDEVFRIFGLSPQEFDPTRKRFYDRLHPDDRAAVMAKIDRWIKAGDRHETEHRIIRPDGEVRVVLERGEAQRDSSGRAIRLIGTVLDITERKQAEAARELLHEIDRQTLQNQPLSQILGFICHQLIERMGHRAAQIVLKERNGQVEAAAQAGPGALLPESALALSLAEEATQQGPVCALPLRAQGETLGALVLVSADGRPYPDQALPELAGFADQVALSVVAARNQNLIGLQTIALESAANSIFMANRDGVITWVNPAFLRLTGYTAEEIVGKTPRVLRSGVHDKAFYERLWETILRGETWQDEIWNQRKDGSLYVSEMTITPVMDEAGELTSYISILQDVTDRKRQEEEVRYMAHHDPLTGLPNRRVLQERLEQAVGAASPDSPATLMLLDLDHFKIVNDTLGHAHGDQLLINLAQVVSRSLPLDSLLARLGGDEFAVLMIGTGTEAARAAAEAVRHAVHDFPFQLRDTTFDMGVSIGAVILDGRLDAPSALILADTALSEAKGLGKNRVVLYESDDESGLRLMEESRWVSRIRAALREGRFQLYYQPIVQLDQGTADYHEVLLRMEDEEGATVPPGLFLPPSQRYGLMSEIDRLVVARAIDVLAGDPSLRLFVNLSGPSLSDDRLLGFVEAELRKTGVASRLAIEVTETAAVTDVLGARRWMSRLKELGCAFALDDFGSGFSSYAYLQQLPVDFVKIDGAFVAGLEDDPSRQAIVTAIHEVARALGKMVIAEHVETATTARLLTQIGVKWAQGYLWGTPGPEPERVGGRAGSGPAH